MSNMSNNSGSLDPKIARLDFTRLGLKLRKEKSWSKDQVKKAERQYRRWLTVKKQHPNKDIVPNRLIDEFWHIHILDTHSYAKDCQMAFGYFLHHYPYFGLNGKDDENTLMSAFDETSNLYKQHFGISMDNDFEASRCAGHSCHSPSDCACRSPGACK